MNNKPKRSKAMTHLFELVIDSGFADSSNNKVVDTTEPKTSVLFCRTTLGALSLSILAELSTLATWWEIIAWQKWRLQAQPIGKTLRHGSSRVLPDMEWLPSDDTPT